MLGFIFFLWKCAVEHFIVNHDDSNLYDGCNSEFIPFQFLLCQISVVKMGLYILIVMLLHLLQFKITLIRLVAHSLNPENTAG